MSGIGPQLIEGWTCWTSTQAMKALPSARWVMLSQALFRLSLTTTASSEVPHTPSSWPTLCKRSLTHDCHRNVPPQQQLTCYLQEERAAREEVTAKNKKAALVKRAAAQQARRAVLRGKEPAKRTVRAVAVAKPISLFQDQKAAQKKKPRLSKMAALSPVEREVSCPILGCQQRCSTVLYQLCCCA